MQDLNDLYFYVQVVDNGGFAAASRALGIPKSKLSRRLQELEERLGVRLLQRSTRKLAVTEIGQEYYRHCVAMLVEAGAAQEAIERSRSGPQGLTRAVSSYGDRRETHSLSASGLTRQTCAARFPVSSQLPACRRTCSFGPESGHSLNI